MKKIMSRVASVTLAGIMAIGIFASGFVTSVSADTSGDELLLDALALGVLDEMSGGYLGDLMMLGILDEAYRSANLNVDNFGNVTYGPQDVDFVGSWLTNEELGYGVYAPDNWELQTYTFEDGKSADCIINEEDNSEYLSFVHVEGWTPMTTTDIAESISKNGGELFGRGVINGIDAVFYSTEDSVGVAFPAPNNPWVLCNVSGHSTDDNMSLLNFLPTLTRL